MHGLGNDFVVIDAINQQVELSAKIVRLLADRHFGIGCDQVLLVDTSTNPEADFRYRIYNADGGEVQQCGNGARCFARFVRDKGLSDKGVIRAETGQGILQLEFESGGVVRVNMGVPRFEPADIPFVADARATRYRIDVDGKELEIGAVSMGNPHAVLRTDNVLSAPVATLGPQLERHPRFPERVNVGFMEVVDPEHIRLRVYERGSGETLACGSGACAAVAVGIAQGLLGTRVVTELSGGRLVISWQGEGEPAWMSGPATTVYEGAIEL